MYVGCLVCCPLVSHGKYTDGKDRQTDGRHTVTLRFPLDAASVINYTVGQMYKISYFSEKVNDAFYFSILRTR